MSQNRPKSKASSGETSPKPKASGVYTILHKAKNMIIRKGTKGAERNKFVDSCDVGCEFQFLQSHLNLKHNGSVTDFYDVEANSLGQGTFGFVTLATHKVTQQRRAIKNVKKFNTSVSEEKQLENEMLLLQQLSHPNILHLIEYFDSPDTLYIVTEIYEGGELFDEIIARQEFTEFDASIVISQLLSCLAYLKGKNVVHRDIKPENIMLEKSKDLTAIKLIDFGNAVLFSPKDKNDKLTEKVGTPYYIAPEVLAKSYDYKCDVWSVGVISYILLCGYPPFNGKDNAAIFKRIETGEFSLTRQPWPTVSDEAKGFVKMLLQPDPEQRVDASEALEHEYLKAPTKGKRRIMKPRTLKTGKSTANSTEITTTTGGSRPRAKSGVINNASAMLGAVVRKLGPQPSNRTHVNKALKNLRKFRCQDKLLQVVYGYCINQCMPKETRENLATVFRSFDTNKDGYLSRDELINGLKKYAPNMLKLMDVDQLFHLMDSDGSGNVEYQEFLVAVSDPKVIMTKENLETVFHLLDKDGDGFITLEELREAVKNDDVLEEVFEEMVDFGDQDQDGQISLEEFIAKITKEVSA